MRQVKKLVNEHADFVHAIAEELLRQGDLTGEEIDDLYVRLYGRARPEPPQVKSGVLTVASPIGYLK
jgi:cell division protease FtsH